MTTNKEIIGLNLENCFLVQRWQRPWLLWIRLGGRQTIDKSIFWYFMITSCGTVVAMMLFLILLFTAFKANDNLRVIQLNEEVCDHWPYGIDIKKNYLSVCQVALMLGFGLLCFDPTEDPALCVASACLVQLFFTGAFTFYLLESKLSNYKIINRKTHCHRGHGSISFRASFVSHFCAFCFLVFEGRLLSNLQLVKTFS